MQSFEREVFPLAVGAPTIGARHAQLSIVLHDMSAEQLQRFANAHPVKLGASTPVNARGDPNTASQHTASDTASLCTDFLLCQSVRRHGPSPACRSEPTACCVSGKHLTRLDFASQQPLIWRSKRTIMTVCLPQHTLEILQDAIRPCVQTFNTVCKLDKLLFPSVAHRQSSLFLPHSSCLQTSPLERAEQHVTLAEAIKVAFDLYLRTQGCDPEEHSISKEEVCTQHLYTPVFE